MAGVFWSCCSCLSDRLQWISFLRHLAHPKYVSVSVFMCSLHSIRCAFRATDVFPGRHTHTRTHEKMTRENNLLQLCLQRAQWHLQIRCCESFYSFFKQSAAAGWVTLDAKMRARGGYIVKHREGFPSQHKVTWHTECISFSKSFGFYSCPAGWEPKESACKEEPWQSTGRSLYPFTATLAC